ncbi:MAG: hypothetical protein WD077_12460 [Bacteroidia bacterium]
MIDQKIAYIHLNPVKAGYVRLPEYPFCNSACPASPLKDMDAKVGGYSNNYSQRLENVAVTWLEPSDWRGVSF